jgi:hypothetical protein
MVNNNNLWDLTPCSVAYRDFGGIYCFHFRVEEGAKNTTNMSNCCMLIGLLLKLKMESVRSSETSVNLSDYTALHRRI